MKRKVVSQGHERCCGAEKEEMQILIYVFSGLSVRACGPSGVEVGGQAGFWPCRKFESNPDPHPLDGSSTHAPHWGSRKGVQGLGLHLPPQGAQV